MAASPAVYRFRQLDAPADSGEDTLQTALAEADAIREAARAQGDAEGRAAAEAAVRAEAADLLAQLAAAHAALDGLRDELVRALEADSVSVGLRLAEQIVAGTIDVAPARLTDIAGLVLRRLADRRTVTLIVNPADLDVLSDAVVELRASLGGIDSLSVQSDRRVGRGGVVARTEEGEIDATVETQITRAREIVAAELGGTAS